MLFGNLFTKTCTLVRFRINFRRSFLRNLSRTLSVCIAFFLFTQCVRPVYNPEIAFSKAWWETEILECVLSGRCLDSTPPLLSVTNLPSSHEGILESGFIVGTASDDLLLTQVLVSLDGGAYQPAQGAQAWRFIVPSSWKSGSLHTISVKSVDFSGNSSQILNFSVRKGKNKDINGDGIADVAITSSFFSTTKNGEISVFYGIGLGGYNPTNRTMAQTTITGSASSSFGYVLSLGDVNADGYSDLVAGASYEYGGNVGKVYVFYSKGPTGIVATTDANADVVLTNAAADQLGYALSLGDVNGDGITDIAASGYIGSGTVRIYAGSSSGVNTTPITSITGPGSNFGSALELGDLNGDGFCDLIVDANTYSGGAGRIYIFHSTGPAGITTTNTASGVALTLTGEAASNNFGMSLQSNDINRDGFEDLTVGAPGYLGNQGAAYVFYGSPTGITAATPTSATPKLTGSTAENFGGFLALGDVNGDGYLDFLSSSSSFAGSMGKISIYHFSGAVISGTPNTVILGEIGGDVYGTAGFSDLNGDGFADLISAAQSNTAGAGKGYIHLSPGGTGITASSPTSGNFIITSSANSAFGSMLTR
ncbi:hypothetical protein EHQ67_14495 [Leptospira kmetyi]|nr:hypothetical protein EHQ67_14495 [Leptospira kmetyi]